MSLKDKLEANVLWFALGLLVAGGGGTLTVLKFIDDRIDARTLSPDFIQRLSDSDDLIRALADGVRSDISTSVFPPATILLTPSDCPAGFEDLTSLLDGHYLSVGAAPDNSIQTRNDTGVHSHAGGTHTHEGDGDHEHKVTGKTAELGDGERYGNNARNAPNRYTKVDVTGTAHKGESTKHKHTGGSHSHADDGKHEHRRVLLRVCKSPDA